jgi:hypothetical protein
MHAGVATCNRAIQATDRGRRNEVRLVLDRSFAQRDRLRQEIRFAPWLAVMTGMGAGAAAANWHADPI